MTTGQIASPYARLRVFATALGLAGTFGLGVVVGSNTSATTGHRPQPVAIGGAPLGAPGAYQQYRQGERASLDVPAAASLGAYQQYREGERASLDAPPVSARTSSAAGPSRQP